MLKRIFATLAVVLLLLVVLPFALWGIAKWRGVSDEGKAALALMSKPWQPTGHNAFADFWLAAYPVPEAERQAVLDADVQLFEQQGDNYQQVSTAAEKWQAEPLSAEDQPMFCHASNGDGCLAAVRADPAGFAALVERHKGRIDRIEVASGGDYIQSPFPDRHNKPFLSYQLAYGPATRYAVQFAQGDKQAALGAVCARIVDWRRLSAQSGSLIDAMVGVGFSGRGYGQLALAMLAELPADAPLPAACEAAFAAPMEQDVSLCNAFRGEFRYSSESIWPQLEEEARKQGKDLGKHPFLDKEMTRADMAAQFAPYCQAGTQTRWLTDVSGVEGKTPDASLWRLSCVSNYIGCVLNNIAGPAHESYAQRLLDRNALLRLMGGVLWLRGKPELLANPERIPAAMPQEYRRGERELSFDAEKNALVLTSNSGGQTWEVPLPASRL